LSCQLRDFLDFITIVDGFINDEELKEEWASFVSKVFNEEGLGYRIDEHSVVHYRIDEALEYERAAALQHLGESRFASVRQEFESAYHRLRAGHADTKAAVKDMAECLEIAFKVVFDDRSISSLGPSEVNKYLIPALADLYEGNQRAKDASRQIAEGFGKWTIAVQLYRHGQKEHEAAPPPLEFAVALLSSGTTFLRLLLDLDHFRRSESVVK
jgi:hypothetical protein